MRKARRTRGGRWYIVDEERGVSQAEAPHWGLDEEGHWPRVELPVKALEEKVRCPACGTSWTFQETDCVFGTAARDRNDVLVTVRCARCRLPHRVRAVGFVTAYPNTVRLMEGWIGWDKRRAVFEAEEVRLYGA